MKLWATKIIWDDETETRLDDVFTEFSELQKHVRENLVLDSTSTIRKLVALDLERDQEVMVWDKTWPTVKKHMGLYY
jgi:hypothetical protein